MKHIHPLARELATARYEQGITQATLASNIQIQRPVLARWENGHCIPTLPYLERWAHSLGYALAPINHNGAAGPHGFRRIVDILTQARKDQQIPQTVLVERMTAASTMLCRWEGKSKTPTLTSLESWASALGYRIALIPRNGGA